MSINTTLLDSIDVLFVCDRIKRAARCVIRLYNHGPSADLLFLVEFP